MLFETKTHCTDYANTLWGIRPNGWRILKIRVTSPPCRGGFETRPYPAVKGHQGDVRLPGRGKLGVPFLPQGLQTLLDIAAEETQHFQSQGIIEGDVGGHA